ncbi:multiple epidermal growth factor-like domains protein 11 isoform X2 [Haliotis rubra]|uniref:multiple epidermal growth factor-like domains protein 11 isoform X2 n=1 Tax=Haliotis rubra TaxID=36100 RepID=UPI001EE54F21|nr:multiple epidermal growth factor-like domains protein 11 isoform X2 [Haliotis rubra]
MAVRDGVVILLASFSLVTGSCLPGTYGYRCGYNCHCQANTCNVTDGCRSQTCIKGWSGPTCQKNNKALDKSTSASSTSMAAGNAVDGNTIANNYRSCFHSAYNDGINVAWWRVDLNETTPIHDVTIYFRTDYKVRRNGIQVYIADTAASPTDGVKCYNVTGKGDGSDILDVLNVTCSGKGRYLVLYTTTINNGDAVPILDFCEVQVDVCAPGTFGSVCDNYCHCAGDVCNFVNGVCPSGVCLPGWQHDECDTECTQFSYGQNCSKKCSDRNCKNDNSSCDHATGMCVGGCKTGWNGTDCTQECPGSYGDGCAYQCSARKCRGTSTCDHVTGKCENGCNPGWKIADCTQECTKGVEYGSGCVGNCSARMCDGGTDACPPDTGQCESTCVSGWQGEDCAQVCSLGSFGENCSEECGQCLDTSDCHHVNGTCITGCVNGWTNHTCTQKQDEGPTSNAGIFTSAGVVVAIIVAAAVVVIVVVLVRRRRSQAANKRDDHADMSPEQIDMMNDPACTNDVDTDDYVNPVYVSGHVADKNDPLPTSVGDSDAYLDPVYANAVDSEEYLDPVRAGAVVVVDEKDEAAVDEDDNDTYYNTATAPAITLVSVDKLQERIQELQVPVGGFQAEYQVRPKT